MEIREGFDFTGQSGLLPRQSSVIKIDTGRRSRRWSRFGGRRRDGAHGTFRRRGRRRQWVDRREAQWGMGAGRGDAGAFGTGVDVGDRERVAEIQLY